MAVFTHKNSSISSNKLIPLGKFFDNVEPRYIFFYVDDVSCSLKEDFDVHFFKSATYNQRNKQWHLIRFMQLHSINNVLFENVYCPYNSTLLATLIIIRDFFKHFSKLSLFLASSAWIKKRKVKITKIYIFLKK